MEMAAARLDQNREEKSSKIRLKIQNSGCGGGSGRVLIVGCCALIAAGIGAAFAARRARDCRGSGGESPRGTRDLAPSVDRKEDPENSRGEIIVDRLVGDQLEDRNEHRDGIDQELSLGGVEDDDDTTQLEIKQKFEGSEIAHVKGFDHREEIPFDIKLHEEEETESSTEGDEGSEGTGDASTESNEEQAWRAALSLDRVEDSVSRFVIEQSSEETEAAEWWSTASSPNHNEVKANMDDASTPIEEGTGHCIKLNEILELGMEQILVDLENVSNTENVGRDCQNTEMGSETLGTQSVSKNTEMVMELGTNIDNGDEVVKELSISVVASYKQVMEKSEIIEENEELLEEFGGEESELLNEVGRSIEEIFPEKVETLLRTDDMVGTAQAEELKLEDLEVTQDSSLESSAEEIKELPSIDLEKIEQVETPMRNNDMVGVDRAEEEQKLGGSEVIQDSSFESSAEENFPEEEEELPSIYLSKIEQVETQKTTDDMVGIEEAEEDQKIEGSEVVQVSSMESSAEETFPEKEEETEVDTPKRTDDMIDIEKAEEESNAEEIFPEEEKEFPSIDLKKIEQVEPPKSACDMVGIVQAEEVQKVEDPEVIRGSESSAEEISSGQEEELPSTDSKKIEQVEPPKMTDDMVGIEQAEGEQEGEGPAEEIFPKKKQELPLFDLQKIEQAETPKSIADIAGIEQAEEEHKVEDPEVVQDSSLKSSTEEIFPEAEIELPPSIVFKKIEQVETPKTADDMVGTAQAEEEEEKEEEEEEEEEDSSLEPSAEEIFLGQGKEAPWIDSKKTEQVVPPKKTSDMAASYFRVFITLLLLAMGLALGLLAFAQPDSLHRRSSHHLPELYHNLSQLLFASYQRAVGEI